MSWTHLDNYKGDGKEGYAFYSAFSEGCGEKHSIKTLHYEILTIKETGFID